MGAAANLVTEPADRVLKIERVFDAPRSLVFKAWTESEHMARWWGPRGFTSTVLKNDPRPGGAIESTCAAPTTTIIGRRVSIANSYRRSGSSWSGAGPMRKEIPRAPKPR